jgi:hypothetical protein
MLLAGFKQSTRVADLDIMDHGAKDHVTRTL